MSLDLDLQRRVFHFVGMLRFVRQSSNQPKCVPSVFRYCPTLPFVKFGARGCLPWDFKYLNCCYTLASLFLVIFGCIGLLVLFMFRRGLQTAKSFAAIPRVVKLDYSSGKVFITIEMADTLRRLGRYFLEL